MKHRLKTLNNYQSLKKKGRSTKTTIDQLIEDPSGMIVGFAIGAASGMPIIGAPIGIAVGAGLNIGFSNALAKTEMLTILDIEIHERTKNRYGTRINEFTKRTNTQFVNTTSPRNPIGKFTKLA